MTISYGKKNYWQGRANRILVLGSFAKILVLKIVPVIHVNNQFKPKKSALTRVSRRRHLADMIEVSTAEDSGCGIGILWRHFSLYKDTGKYLKKL